MTQAGVAASNDRWQNLGPKGDLLMDRLRCFVVSTTWSRLCALMVISLAAIATKPAQAEVKIGFQAPLTGAAATDGVSAKIAAEMASEKINSGGGVLGQKIELVTYDDQAKTEEAVFTANKLVGQDGVKFAVSGSYSASGRAAAPIPGRAARLQAQQLRPRHRHRCARVSGAQCGKRRRRARGRHDLVCGDALLSDQLGRDDG